ncbi:MAG: FkbM family methyltransferase [Leptospirales bacterium]
MTKLRCAINIYQKTKNISLVYRLYELGLLKSASRFLNQGGVFYIKNNQINAKTDLLDLPIQENSLTASIYALEIFSDLEKDSIKIENSDGVLNIAIKDGLPLKFDDLSTFLVFWEILSEYDVTDVMDRTIIDIGAHKGDSLLYFIWRGARRVIAFEPIEKFYNQALLNISLNGFEKRVFLFNLAIGGDIFDFNLDQNQYIACDSGKEKLNLISFDSFLSKILNIGVGDHWVLKMDCEGCEFPFLLTEGNLGKLIQNGMSEIILEYHDSIKIQELKKKFIENGLIIDFESEKRKNLGLLHAKLTPNNA